MACVLTMPYGKKWGWSKEEVRKFVKEIQGVTVPVDISFRGNQKIMSSEQVEKLLRKASTIALAECECRAKVQACDAPRDVCLYLNEGAREHIKRGMGEKIDLKSAMSVLARSSEAGLVLVAYTDVGEKKSDPEYICSCCSCCCHAMIALQRYGFNEAIVSSDMIAQQHDETCTDCGACVDKCQFNARKMVDGKLVFASQKCFGCGLCVGECGSGAISLASRH